MPASTSSEGLGRTRARQVLAGCVAAALLGVPLPSPAADEEGCLGCHGLAEFALRAGGELRVLGISPQRYEESAHAALGCRDCHADVASIPHGGALRPVACGQSCHAGGEEAAGYSHEKIWWEHAASAHGTTKRGALGCLVCHPSPEQGAAQDRLGQARRCAACHRDAPSVLAWFSDRHGRALAAGNPRAPSCPDCHTAHRVRPASDPEAAVSGARLATTCSGGALGSGDARRCHGALAPAAVAGARMNQLPRDGSGRGTRAVFSGLFAVMIAGLLLRAGIGLVKGR